MNELTILGEIYQFNFGMGFLRTIDKIYKRTEQGIEIYMGLAVIMSRVMEKDIDSLWTVLNTANRGYEPRLRQEIFDRWIEDPNTDIDDVFKRVEDFFAQSNCTKTMYKRLMEVEA